MAHRSLIWAALLVLAWLGSAVEAQAAFANATPPMQWVGGVSGGSMLASAGSEIAKGSDDFLRLLSKPSILGKEFPAAARIGSEGVRVIAKRAFLGPGLVPMMALWAAQAGIQYWWDEVGQKWVQAGQGPQVFDDGSKDVGWVCTNGIVDGTYFASFGSGAGLPYEVRVISSNADWPDGFEFFNNCPFASHPAGGYPKVFRRRVDDFPEAEPAEVTPQEFEDAFAPHADKLPAELVRKVGVPIPVDLPKLNPQPGPDGESTSFDIPQGSPVPNPNFDSEQEPSTSNPPYLQPTVRVIPQGTAAEPWRVEVRPYDKPALSSEPSAEPIEQLPGGEGGGSPPTAKPPGEAGLCEQYPDILACQKVGEVESAELETKAIDFEFEPVEGFAPGGTCPSPIVVEYLGRNIELSWEPLCDSLVMVRPLLLAFAWASAAFILIGARESL